MQNILSHIYRYFLPKYYGRHIHTHTYVYIPHTHEVTYLWHLAGTEHNDFVKYLQDSTPHLKFLLRLSIFLQPSFVLIQLLGALSFLHNVAPKFSKARHFSFVFS